jgi:hypothetical protein
MSKRILRGGDQGHSREATLASVDDKLNLFRQQVT